MTCILSTTPDPQRDGEYLDPETKLLDELLDSLDPYSQPVIFIDQPLRGPLRTGGERYVMIDRVNPNPYFDRWRIYREWLTVNSWVKRAWCVDASDVVMLNAPWAQMEPDAVYVGDEAEACVPEPGVNPTPSQRWLRSLHPSIGGFLDVQGHRRTMLNGGLVGGHRRALLEFLAALDVDCWAGDVTDMGALNVTAASRRNVVHGSLVNTTFRAYERSGSAFWAHK